MVNKALRHDSDNDADELHGRDQAISSTQKESHPSFFIPLKAFPRIVPKSDADPELDGQVSDTYTQMRNRARIINAALISGTVSLFVASYSAINFFIVMFATPVWIAKIRYLKFGMSVSGSACMFFNAICIFILCYEMKYSIEHYVKKPKL